MSVNEYIKGADGCMHLLQYRHSWRSRSVYWQPLEPSQRHCSKCFNAGSMELRCLQPNVLQLCLLVMLQFAADGEERYHNRAAVLHLSGPDYATPAVDSFEAVLPRPPVSPRTVLPCSATVTQLLTHTPPTLQDGVACVCSMLCAGPVRHRAMTELLAVVPLHAACTAGCTVLRHSQWPG
jgi:hypothetical protein